MQNFLLVRGPLKTIGLAIFFTFFVLLSIFFFYCWWETKEGLVREIEINEDLKNQIVKLQEELSREREDKKNLMTKLGELQDEIEKLRQEIEKLKNPHFKKKIRLPILIYHHINYLSPTASKVKQDLTVTPPTFEKQMAYLFEQNYQPITFEEFLQFIKNEKEIPEKSLIITFDDGWKTQYQYALPILKKYNFRAVFFVTVNSIGAPAFMNWKELRELLAEGMEIGSHTLTHPNLVELSDSSLLSEIRDSKIILEKNLGQKINVFAYPYGAFDERIIEVVRESNYLAGRTAIGSPYQNLENPYTLKAIQVYDSLEQFENLFPPRE